MRLRLFWLGGLLLALLGPAVGLPQSGGPPGRGGFTMDRDERFSQYTGGKDVWDRAQIADPDGLRRFDSMAQQLGVTNGVITRQQYVDYYQQRDSRGGPPMRMTLPDGASALFPAAGGAPSFLQSPTALPGTDSRGRSGRGGPEGGANWAESGFRRYDKNGDGVLDNDEIPEALRNERDRWDNNRNGFIDSTEFKTFVEGRMQQWQAERAASLPSPSSPGDTPRFSSDGAANPAEAMFSALMNRMAEANLDRGSSRSFDPYAPGSSGRGGPGAMPVGRSQPEEERRPIVYRPGSLPQGLPGWFTQRDTDGDGQVGLYEWRAGGESLSEFERLDANNDGFVTAEEVLRDQAVAARQAPSGPAALASSKSVGGSGGGSSFSRGGDRGSVGSRSVVIPGMEKMENLPIDRERLIEMMMRGRDGTMPSWRGGNGSTGNGSPAWSGERGGSGGRRSMGTGGGNGSASGDSRSPTKKVRP